jgi:STE24 endopeptidase
VNFSLEERERASCYHRPLYAALVVRLAVVVAVYGLLARVSPGRLGWAGGAALWAAVVVIAAGAACLPLDLWVGLIRERRWGLSTQTLGGWLVDRAKGEAIGIVLSAVGWIAVVGLARALPRWWPAAAAAGLAAAVLVLSVVAPLVLEPLFNRFSPLGDERLAGELRELADRAGVPIGDVLVADASRRTRKRNAYVSGLGPTRRLVVWDTLAASTSEPELKLIVAHELGHRLERHVLKATALAMAGAAIAVVVVWAALGTPEPREFPLAALLVVGLQLGGLPLFASMSRRWERTADRCSLELTNDPDAFTRAYLALARANLSDLAPPRLAYLMLFTHPTPPERLALARAHKRANVQRSSEAVS